MTKKKTDHQKQSADIEKIISERDEYLAGWKRSLADLDNMKRQIEREKDQLTTFLKAKVLQDILPIVANLEKAFEQVPADQKDSDWIKGMESIQKQLNEVLQSNGAKRIKTIGESFDPNIHEAIMQEEKEGVKPGIIIEEFTPGFSLGDHVIQYPKVKVSQ